MKELSAACDTSVLVPALHPGHAEHLRCREQLVRLTALPAHVLLESYRVLTAGTDSGVLSPAAVARVLDSLGIPLVQLPHSAYFDLVQTMASARRPGGAIYDAQIAATAKHYGLTLISRDRRAAATYDTVGVDYELI